MIEGKDCSGYYFLAIDPRKLPEKFFKFLFLHLSVFVLCAHAHMSSEVRGTCQVSFSVTVCLIALRQDLSLNLEGGC